MLLGILHRMVFMELARVFLLALLGLTGMLLMAGVVAEATQHGLGPGQILGVIPLLIPSTLPYTLPATTLFATCIVYGRLAADNEVLALKASGIHPLHLAWPALLLGLAAGGTTLGLYFDVIPSTHHELRTRFLKDMEEFLYSMLKREGQIRHPKIDFEIHVKRVEGRRLVEALFKRRDPKGQRFDIIAWAREAELLVDMPRKQILVHMRHCHIQSEDGRDDAYVEDKVWPVDLPPEFGIPPKGSPREMTWPELLDHRVRLEQEANKAATDIALHQERINAGTGEPHFDAHIRNLAFAKRLRDNQVRSIEAELQMRPALAVGCLCFVLVGCPVGIWFSRSDYLSAFITCFLPIVLVYYPLLLCGINLAKLGRIDPVPALWAANGLILFIALLLFRRLLRH